MLWYVTYMLGDITLQPQALDLGWCYIRKFIWLDDLNKVLKHFFAILDVKLLASDILTRGMNVSMDLLKNSICEFLLWNLASCGVKLVKHW